MTTKVLSREALLDVLCCAECEKPLHIDPLTGGGWCVGCGYPPSMQDTFIMRVCRSCGKEAKRDGDLPAGRQAVLRCPCGVSYR